MWSPHLHQLGRCKLDSKKERFLSLFSDKGNLVNKHVNAIIKIFNIAQKKKKKKEKNDRNQLTLNWDLTQKLEEKSSYGQDNYALFQCILTQWTGFERR